MNDFIQQWERITSLWKRGRRCNENMSNIACEEKEMLQQIFEIRQAMNDTKARKYNVDHGWRKMQGRLRYVRLRSMSKYVAVFFFLFLCIYFLIPNNMFEEKQMETNVEIKPGKLQARLHLTTGECLALNVHQSFNKQVSSGIEIWNDTVKGKVVYRMIDNVSFDSLKLNELLVPKGGEYSLELSDGSVVWVNSESSLLFPNNFAKSQREVYLKGEAYFNVKKEAGKPFIVHTENGDIQVLGTSFNVSAYPEDELWQTTLVEGQVMICRKQGKVLMNPNEQYQINTKTGMGELKPVVSELYVSWRNGKFYFKAYTFEQLVERLERWYDFKMFYANESIKNRRFSGVINKHEPLQVMLTFLEMASDIQFDVKGNIVTASLKSSK